VYTRASSIRSDGPSKSSSNRPVQSHGRPKRGRAPPAPAPAPNPAIGTTQEVTIGDATARVTVSSLVPIKASEFYTVKGNLVGTTVTIEVVSGTVSANPLYFSARTAAGDSIDVALGAADNQFNTTDVKAGQKLRGVVAFDVPAGSKISLVLMSDTGLSQVATWTVA
jgi:hypothetical protein